MISERTLVNSKIQKFLLIFLGVLLMAVATGCGTVQHKVDFKSGYFPQTNTMIEVSSVTNETGETFDINIEKMLSNALAEALRDEELLWTGNESPKLVLESKIIEYKKGDAFKRWLLPGWGSTVLIIQSDLRDNNGIVGSVEAKRTVSIGGGYTIGAWKTVFASIAKDVVKDLRKHIKE